MLQIQPKSLQELHIPEMGRARKCCVSFQLRKSSAGTGPGFKAEASRGPEDAIHVRNALEMIRNKSSLRVGSRVSDHSSNLGQKLKERRFICLPGARPAPPAAAGVPECPSQLWGGTGTRIHQGAELFLEIQLPIPNPLQLLLNRLLFLQDCLLTRIQHSSSLSGSVFLFPPKQTAFSRLCPFVSS